MYFNFMLSFVNIIMPECPKKGHSIVSPEKKFQDET